MIRICTQVMINATQQVVWDTLVDSQTREAAQQEMDESNAEVAKERVALTGQILTWNEGETLAIQAQAKPILNSMKLEFTLQALDNERTSVNVSTQLETPLGCLVTPIYRYIFKQQTHNFFKKMTAELKYQAEQKPPKGKPIDDLKLPISAVQIIECQPTTLN